MLFFDLRWIFCLFLIFGDFPKFEFFWSKPEPAEPEPVAVGTEPHRTEPWVSCAKDKRPAAMFGTFSGRTNRHLHTSGTFSVEKFRWDVIQEASEPNREPETGRFWNRNQRNQTRNWNRRHRNQKNLKCGQSPKIQKSQKINPESKNNIPPPSKIKG